MKQPFTAVELENGTKIIINENHIVAFFKQAESMTNTMIEMSNGAIYTIVKPEWNAWQLDQLTRKE